MSKKYNLTSSSVILRTLLFLAPTFFTCKIVAMDIGKETVGGITYQEERMQELQSLFVIKNLGEEIFSKENVDDFYLRYDPVSIKYKDGRDEVIKINKLHAELLAEQLKDEKKEQKAQREYEEADGKKAKIKAAVADNAENIHFCSPLDKVNMYFIIYRNHYTWSMEIKSSKNDQRIGKLFENVYCGDFMNYSCIFSKDQKLVFIPFKNRTGKLINVETGAQIGNDFKNIQISAEYCTFSKDGKFAVIKSYNEDAILISTLDRRQLLTFKDFCFCKFSNNSKKLIVIQQPIYNEEMDYLSSMRCRRNMILIDIKLLEIKNTFTNIAFCSFTKDNNFLKITNTKNISKFSCRDGLDTEEELFDIKNNKFLLKETDHIKKLYLKSNILLLLNNKNKLFCLEIRTPKKQDSLFKKNLIDKQMLAGKKEKMNGFCDTRINFTE